jgi:probable HAF family extracellular repeat protein
MTIAAVAVILWSVLASFSKKPPQYDIINLGNFGRDHIEPHAINDHGQIAGYFCPLNALSDGPIRAFIYDDVNGFTEIDKRCTSPWGLDINNRGHVVGGNASSPVLNTGSLFIWDPESGTTDIIGETGTIVQGNNEINNKGRIVGTIMKPNPSMCEAFVWDKEKGFTLLGTLGGKNSVACSINDKGQVAGWSETDEGYRHGFIFDDVNAMTDLGTLGGDVSIAFAVNNTSQVLGYSSDSKGNSYIVIWDRKNNARRIKKVGNNRMDWRIALNDNGQMIGTYRKGTSSWSVGRWFCKRIKRRTACPFIWSKQQGFVDLDNIFAADPEWTSFYIVDINNKGQILGYGQRINSGGYHIFILQPKKKNSESKNQDQHSTDNPLDTAAWLPALPQRYTWL